MTRGDRVLVVDNYDSFVHTLVAYLRRLGAQIDVVRNDEVPEEAVAELLAGYDGAVVSPGPGTPTDAGVSIAVVRAAFDAAVPLLGVCLGHQAIAEAFGATVARADELMHGRTSRIRHHGSGLFAGLPEPFTATRYHSLAVVEETLPAELVVTARSEEGVVMALRHASAPLVGVQFHPEAVLTEGGLLLLANWLDSFGGMDARDRAAMMPLTEYTG